MRFKAGFVIGTAAGIWAARRAAALRSSEGSKSAPLSGDEAAEKLRALSGLAKERLSDLIEGPLGTMARERLTEMIGASLGGSGSTEASDRAWRGDDPIDTTAR